MGVTYSSEISTGEDAALLRLKERLRLPFDLVQRLVVAYQQHSFQPVLDETGVRTLLAVAVRGYIVGDPAALSTVSVDDLFEAVWVLFSDAESTCFAQEILVCAVLLVHTPWSKRLSLLFDVFKCLGLEEVHHEDLQLMAQVAASGLLRLWRCPPWAMEDLRSLTEAIADHAFLKLDKELSEGVAREHFCSWAVDRFRESRTVATSQALALIYSTTYT